MTLTITQTLTELQSCHAQSGRLEWLGIRPQHRDDMIELDTAVLLIGQGIEGDHYAGKTVNGERQVTLIQAEHLPVIASLCGLATVYPAQLRRNLMISGINIAVLKDQRFTLGATELEGTGYCHPCSRMEENLGRGGYNAVRNHGGMTARVVTGSRIARDDRLTVIWPG